MADSSNHLASGEGLKHRTAAAAAVFNISVTLHTATHLLPCSVNVIQQHSCSSKQDMFAQLEVVACTAFQ